MSNEQQRQQEVVHNKAQQVKPRTRLLLIEEEQLCARLRSAAETCSAAFAVQDAVLRLEGQGFQAR